MLQRNVHRTNCVLIIILLMLCTGCGFNRTTVLSNNEILSDETSNNEHILNPYFPYMSSFEKGYQGRFFLQGEEEQREIKVVFKQLKKGKEGELWDIFLEESEIVDETLEVGDGKYRSDKGNVFGLYFIEKDKIYWLPDVETLSDDQMVNLCEKGEIEKYKNAIIVCQEDASQDVLEADEVGNHVQIDVYDEIRDYCSWYASGNVADFESVCEMVWEKDEGLVAYKNNTVLWEKGMELWDDVNVKSKGLWKSFYFRTENQATSEEDVIEDKALGAPLLTLEEEINVPNEGKVSMLGKDNFTYIFLEKRDKQIELAKFEMNCDNYHLEAFKDILGFSGFKLFLKSSPPYNAEVVYVALINGKTKMILENHAIFEEKTNKYNDVFQYRKDIDNDGIKEIISNIYYTAGGGSRAVLYDVEDDDVLAADLTRLLPDSEEIYYSRSTDLQSWYDEKIDKVVIKFFKTQDSDMITKEYEINRNYIKMEKGNCSYLSDELKDYGKDK